MDTPHNALVSWSRSVNCCPAEG